MDDRPRDDMAAGDPIAADQAAIAARLTGGGGGLASDVPDRSAVPADEAEIDEAPSGERAGAEGAPAPTAGDNVVPFTSAKKRRKRETGRKGGDAPGGPAEPRDLGYSADGISAEWAVVLVGSKALMIHEHPDAPPQERLRLMAVEAFHIWHANKFTEILDRFGEVKPLTWSQRWITSPERREYRGVRFFPLAPGETEADPPPGYLNLWRGYGCAPAAPPAAKAPLAYATFLDHLRVNVCREDAALFRWVWAWLAHMVQRPRERIGTALVMRGKMGAGKSKVGEVIGSLFPAHYAAVDNPRFVVGNFNAHMASCLLLQCDEAVWAGDKTAEGRLKGLVTSSRQMIESKGVDPVVFDNFVRLIMTSNENWVVPAGPDERRFCVLDIDPRCAGNHEYFAQMDREMDAGGRAALLRDLLATDLTGVNLRLIPRTAALLEQKIESLRPIDHWWFGRLMAGRIGPEHWPELAPTEYLYEDYVKRADTAGVKRKGFETELRDRLEALVPGVRKRKYASDLSAQRRVWHYELPPLDACREAFEAFVGQPVSWPEEEA